MNPLLHQCFFLLDLATGKFSNFINRYYGIYKKFVCSGIKRRCRHKGRHDNALDPSTSLRMTRCKAVHFGELGAL